MSLLASQHDADFDDDDHRLRCQHSWATTALRFLFVAAAIFFFSVERFSSANDVVSMLRRGSNHTVAEILEASVAANGTSTSTLLNPSGPMPTDANDDEDAQEDADSQITTSSKTTTSPQLNSVNITDATETTFFEDKLRSKLVFHIGPLKTGTTTIQADLTGLNFRGHLLQDGWYYATEGQAVDDATQSVRPMKEISGTSDDFIPDLKSLLDQLKGHNVVHSFEGWSVDFADHPGLYWKLHQALSDDWDITIVSGYRPYFDWIVSLWSQTQKRDPFKYSNPDDWPWFEKNGKHVRTSRLLPNVYEFWMSKLHWFTDAIVDGAKPFFDVRTYSMDDDPRHRDLSVAFVCDCLEGATTSCQEMQEQMEKRHPHENKGSLNAIHYDALGLAAHAKGLIADHYTRYQIQQSIQHRVEVELTQTAMQNWPMLCPEQDLLDEIWEKSLQLEKSYMPVLWQTNDRREEDLRAKFDEKVENRSFCHANADAMLEDREWLRFFERFQGDFDMSDDSSD